MKTIDVFYQGDGIRALEHLEAHAEVTCQELLSLIASKHGLAGECLLFLEDEDEPVDQSS
jgi:hypothetical protein